MEAATRKDKKKTQAEFDARTYTLTEKLTVAKEAKWLYEKFGEGEYADVLGLCKVATIAEIEEKGFSLTPGAYVGVPPAEDDGVDFNERMREIQSELVELQEQSNTLMATITKNFEELGL